MNQVVARETFGEASPASSCRELNKCFSLVLFLETFRILRKIVVNTFASFIKSSVDLGSLWE